MPQLKRAHWHDYRSRCIYMVTLSKQAGVPDFGRLAGSTAIPVGQRGATYVAASATGAAVKAALRGMAEVDPCLRLLQYALMPDHLHMLLEVTAPAERTLGQMVAVFKTRVNAVAGLKVFADGFNDQILKTTRSLDALYRYLRENPRRLAMRREHPEYFRRVNNITIGGIPCQAYGNLLLSDCPFKEQVIVHRADTDDIFSANKDRWLYTAANRGVLVSPFISERERRVRAEAEALGGRLIHITAEPMAERYKPAAHDFALCEEGRLLILSIAADEKALTRATCLRMNELAHTISAGSAFRFAFL